MSKKPKKVQISCYVEESDYNALVKLNPNMVQENVRQAIKLFLLKTNAKGKATKAAPEVIADHYNDISEEHLLNSIEHE